MTPARRTEPGWGQHSYQNDQRVENMTQEPPLKTLTEFEATMRELLGDHAEDIELLKDIPTIQHALVQHEVKRLDRKLGTDHPRVRHLRSNLSLNTDIIRSFSPDPDRTREGTSSPGPLHAVIMGRLVDEKNLPMAGMIVDIEDEGGRKIPYLDGVRTDDAGNFIISMEPEDAAKVRDGVGGTGYLTVRDHTGKVVHQDAAPLRPDAGGQMAVNLAVPTERFSGKESALKSRGPVMGPSMDGSAMNAMFGTGSPGKTAPGMTGGRAMPEDMGKVGGTAPLDAKGPDGFTASHGFRPNPAGDGMVDLPGSTIKTGPQFETRQGEGPASDRPTIFTAAPQASTGGEGVPVPKADGGKGGVGSHEQAHVAQGSPTGGGATIMPGGRQPTQPGAGGSPYETGAKETVPGGSRTPGDVAGKTGIPATEKGKTPALSPPQAEDLSGKPTKHGFLRKK